jgi:hypothetical protein
MKLKVHKLRANNLYSANRYYFIITVQQSNRTFPLLLDFHGVLFYQETNREENLVAAAGVLELARVEARAAAEEVVSSGSPDTKSVLIPLRSLSYSCCSGGGWWWWWR